MTCAPLQVCWTRRRGGIHAGIAPPVAKLLISLDEGTAIGEDHVAKLDRSPALAGHEARPIGGLSCF
jgi:hypothetical protein